MDINIRLTCLILLLGLVLPASAQVDTNRRLLTAEYGVSYHDIQGEEKDNNTKGTIVSQESPYWKGIWTHRLTNNFGYRLSLRTQLVEFEPPKNIILKGRKQAFVTGELGLLWQQSPYSQSSIFTRHQQRMIYRADTTSKFEMLKRTFVEPGVGYQLGNRRRLGLQFGLGAEVYLMLPTEAENIATATGFGYAGQARLGWVTASGIVIHVKAFYSYGNSPNSTITFAHTEVGYALQTTYSF